MTLAQKRALIKRRKQKRSRRGVALIMVLGAITVLTVFLTELQEETSSELASALADRDALRAEYYARSAINLSRLLIAIEPEIRKPLQMFGVRIPQIPVWEFTDMVLGTFNDQSGAQAFNGMVNADPTTAKNMGLTGGGRFELKIIDEDSKININNASRDLISIDRLATQILGLVGQPSYNPMFEGRDADNQFTDRQTICGAIVDWADEDENLYPCDPKATGPSAGGAEDNFYQMIGLGYRRKNAPYDSLEELRLVRGIGDDFWATFVDPDPSDPHKRTMTVWGQAGNKINVNTADALTQLALICSDLKAATDFCSDPTQVSAFIMVMSMVKSFGAGIPIYGADGDFVKTMQGQGLLGPILTSMGVKPITFTNAGEITKQVTLKSKVFSIYATGIVPGNRRTTKVTIHAVVDFRAATALGTAFGTMGGAGSSVGFSQIPQAGNTAANTTAQPQGGANTRNNQDPSQMTPDQLAQVLATNPAGTVIYWRVE
ncbi:MAG: type II secretion system protein GspK [Byssovorax sp.]